MNERQYKDLFASYVEDDYCTVECVDLKVGNTKICQVIEVHRDDYSTPSYYDLSYINHYEGKSYKEIFEKVYADNLLESIENYDYLLARFKGLEKVLLNTLDKWKKQKGFKMTEELATIEAYLKYVSKWYRDHKEGVPARFYEWEINEHQEDVYDSMFPNGGEE